MIRQLENTEGHMDRNVDAARIRKATREIAAVFPADKEWAGMDAVQRRWHLDRAGTAMHHAFGYGKPMMIEASFPQDGIRGAYKESDFTMRINERLLESDRPDQALKTYAHEWFHSYQNQQAELYDSRFRHLCHNGEQAREWSDNLKPGKYISPKEDFRGYLNQPLERDARIFAERMRSALETRMRIREYLQPSAEK